MLSRYDEACGLIEPEFIMVQEFIPGGADSQFSYAALALDGSPVASLVAQRCRQYPVVFGNSSSFVQSIECQEVEDLARKLLAAMRFTGLVEVEFKRDCSDAQLKLLDVNPRIWGWHTLGARAGVDFAYLAWRMANGLSVPPARGAAGISWLRFTTDALALFQQLRRRELSPLTYIRSLRAPLELAIWAADDPLPSVGEIPAWWPHGSGVVVRSALPDNRLRSREPLLPVGTLSSQRPHSVESMNRHRRHSIPASIAMPRSRRYCGVSATSAPAFAAAEAAVATLFPVAPLVVRFKSAAAIPMPKPVARKLQRGVIPLGRVTVGPLAIENSAIKRSEL